MKKIYQLFKGHDSLAQKIGFRFSQFPNKLCWYPNANFNFGLIASIETFSNNHFGNHEKPTVYIYSNHFIEHLVKGNQNNPFLPGEVLYKDNYENEERVISVIESFELQLKKDIYFPFSTVIDSKIYNYGRDRYTGRVYFILLELNFIYNFRKVKIEIPLFYFTYDNLNLLYDLFIKHQLKINYIVNDFNYKNQFNNINIKSIIQFQDVLKTNCIISKKSVDSITEKHFTDSSNDALISIFMHGKYNRYNITDTNKYSSYHLFDMFKNTWQDMFIRDIHYGNYYKWMR
jgi:hypothetical protein